MQTRCVNISQYNNAIHHTRVKTLVYISNIRVANTSAMSGKGRPLNQQPMTSAASIVLTELLASLNLRKP